MYTELKNKIVKTKKPHQCAWCAEQIETGNLANYRAYIHDGDFSHDWMHPECAKALGEIDFDDDDCWIPGDFARGKCYA